MVVVGTGYSKQTDKRTLNYEEMTADHYSQEP